MQQLERIEMIKIFDWIRHNNLGNIAFHIGNEGRRTPQQGAMLKRMGMLPGVSDIFIARAAHGFHGCFIEVKVKPNKVTQSQLRFIQDMIREGYGAIACYGADEVIEYLQWYLDL